MSVSLIERFTPDISADSILDVGGGASPLVTDVVAKGARAVSVLDISSAALDLARSRLGSEADAVSWIHADLLRWKPPRHYAVWHDRAVLHFLVSEADRRKYRRVLLAATEVGSIAVIGVFGEDGPTKCSGLDVQRFSPELLQDTVGNECELLSQEHELHVTPDGSSQQFLWAAFRRT